MKHLIFLIFMSFIFVYDYSYAEVYEVNVKRHDKDIYKINGNGTFVLTKFCNQFISYDDAILKYSAGAYDNKLIFSNGNSCDVQKVLIKNNSVLSGKYNVFVSKISDNFYQVSSGSIYILTSFCFDYSFSSNAILQYSAGGYDSKLIFQNGKSCTVELILSGL